MIALSDTLHARPVKFHRVPPLGWSSELSKAFFVVQDGSAASNIPALALTSPVANIYAGYFPNGLLWPPRYIRCLVQYTYG